MIYYIPEQKKYKLTNLYSSYRMTTSSNSCLYNLVSIALKQSSSGKRKSSHRNLRSNATDALLYTYNQ